MALTTDFAGIDPGSRTADHKQDYSRYRIVPARHPGRLAGTIFAALVIAAVLYSTFTNPRWGWDVFAEWFFAEPVLVGLGRTLLLTVLADRFRFCPRHGTGAGPRLEIAAAVRPFLGLYLAAALDPADRAAAGPQQSRLSLRDDHGSACPSPIRSSSTIRQCSC